MSRRSEYPFLEVIAMRDITPEHMAALAESASSALELLEYERPMTKLVSQGIADAEKFCDYLQGGLIRRISPEKLSPTSLAEGELLELVFQIEDQETLQEYLPTVRQGLQQLHGSLAGAPVAKLRDFFSQFAIKLDQVSGLHRKIASET